MHPSGVPSNLARFQLQQIPGQRRATTNAANEGSGSSSHSLSPSTPLSEVIGTRQGGSASQVSETPTIAVGVNTPPVPLKLAERIWRKEFIDLSELLPARLGAPELTLMDLIAKRDKVKESKKIHTIEQWVVCFNTYISVMSIRYPERVIDLLAYSSTITKASADYEDTPWLAYDCHFRKLAEANGRQDWSQVESSLWTLYFANASRKRAQESLSVVPVQEEAPTGGPEADRQKSSGGKWQAKSARQEPQHPQPYWKKGPQICRRWNRAPGGCNDPACTYFHICLECHARDHKITRCPLNEPNPVKARSQQSFRGSVGNLQ